MSEKGDIDDQWTGWLDSMTRCGMVAMRREEFREHMDALQTEAYADGRADEREEWMPVLEALRLLKSDTERYHGGKGFTPTFLDEAMHKASAAIEKAGG
jgi:hypothetical protein